MPLHFCVVCQQAYRAGCSGVWLTGALLISDLALPQLDMAAWLEQLPKRDGYSTHVERDSRCSEFHGLLFVYRGYLWSRHRELCAGGTPDNITPGHALVACHALSGKQVWCDRSIVDELAPAVFV
jgi:hypothetical protein